MNKCGMVSVVGLPNAGKSSLVNALVGEKVSIVTRKVQTTRMRIMGITTKGETQVIFVDTPGFFAPKDRLQKAMIKAISVGMAEADVILLVVDVHLKDPVEKNQLLLTRLQATEMPIILVLNKVDLVKKERLLEIASAFSDVAKFHHIFMVSAIEEKEKSGLEKLEQTLEGMMPEGKWLFPEDQYTNISSRVLAAEITREKVFHFMHDELPYQLHVQTEKWERLADDSLKIYQVIYIMEKKHRPMILGKKGEAIKRISMAARAEMEAVFQTKCHLFLNVSVDEKWQDKKEWGCTR